jgi:Helix-turn-helix
LTSGSLAVLDASKGHMMAGGNWRRLADYVVARRVALGMRDRRALALATGVTERTLGKLENGQRVSASTLGAIENQLGWAPGSCRRILAGGEPVAGTAAPGEQQPADPTLEYLASTPGLPPEVVRGLIALARNWRQAQDEAAAAPDQDRRQA